MTNRRNPLPDVNTTSFAPPPPPYILESPPRSNAAPSFRQSLPPQSSPPRVAQQQRPASTATGSGLQRSNTIENQLAILRRYDTILLVDDSASMGHQGRWQEARDAAVGLATKVTEFDADGIDIFFLCSTAFRRNLRSPNDAHQLFAQVLPEGESTPTETRVVDLLGPYVDLIESNKKAGQQLPKPLNLICITDGASDDPYTLSSEIANYADRLDDIRVPLNQLGIQFIQIGDDVEATESLRELDDDLKSTSNPNRRDIVDTTPYAGRIDANFLLKALLGGINRRMDASASRSR